MENFNKYAKVLLEVSSNINVEMQKDNEDIYLF